jgi:hypothetical protein
MGVAELALRSSMPNDEIECIEEGGTEPTIPLLRRLAASPLPLIAAGWP